MLENGVYMNIKNIDKIMINIQDVPLRQLCNFYSNLDYPDYFYIQKIEKEWYFILDIELWRGEKLANEFDIDIILP